MVAILYTIIYYHLSLGLWMQNSVKSERKQQRPMSANVINTVTKPVSRKSNINLQKDKLNHLLHGLINGDSKKQWTAALAFRSRMIFHDDDILGMAESKVNYCSVNEVRRLGLSL